MRKILRTVLGIILMFMLVACGGNKVDGETAEIYISKAEEVIDLLNESDYEAVHDMFGNSMKTALSVKEMEELTPVIRDSGSFEAIDKSSVEETDGVYVTVMVAKYSNENRTFTISLNDNEEVVGLFIK